jgi:Dolichyl-phosphate-mannose-protein mannosyltransferase
MDLGSSPCRRIVLRIIVFALGIRVLSLIIAVLVTLSFPVSQREQFTVSGSPNPVLDTFARYDSGWYYQIARHGYRFVAGGPSVGVGKPGKIAYFPVYPLSMRYGGRLFGNTSTDIYLGGVLVSWASFAAAMVALFFLARLDLPAHRAERAVLLTAVFPFSFFFGMVYTESLFLLVTVLTFYAFRSQQWLLGGVSGALATATRVNGVLMVPALAWIAYRTAAPALRSRLMAVTGLVIALAGVGGYSLYVYQLTGNPFEWASSIQRWGYVPGGAPWVAPMRLIQDLAVPHAYLTGNAMAPYDILYGVTAIAFIVLTPFVWWKLGAAYGIFMLLNLWLPLSSGVFEGVGRYCSVLFPAFIALAMIESSAVFTGIVVMFALFYTLGLALFTTTHPLF